jgi:hypothetical protein
MKNEANYPELVHWAEYFPADENKLGTYLKRSGQSVGLRLDFRITNLIELKRCCVIVSNLNAAIQKYAYQVEGEPVLRVMIARQKFAEAKSELKFIDDRAVKQRAQDKLDALAFVERHERHEVARLKAAERMAIVGLKRHGEMAELRAKQDAKLAKSKPTIDLGNIELGLLPKPKKESRIVALANKKRAVGYG